MNIAVILCGGNATRMNMKGSKQLIELEGKPVFLHSFEKFENHPYFSHIIVIYNSEYKKDFEKWLSGKNNYSLVECGKERYESSYNALKFIKNNFSNAETVAIHDGARPFFKNEMIENLIIKIKKFSAAIPVTPLKPTIKQCENNMVIKTVPRQNIYCVETPQFFNFNKIYSCYTDCKDMSNITDDAELMELNGEKVATVNGDENNIKITTQNDIMLADFILKYGALNK